MSNIFKLNLQLFADGGEGGGEGATSGENSGVPGQSRLLELGVPADKIRNRQKKSETPLPKGAVLTEGPEQTTQVAAAKPTEEPKANTTDSPKRMTMDEILADPEYNKGIQSIIQTRLKSAKSAEETLTKMDPVIEVLARKHGLDPQSPTFHDDLVEAVNNDNSYYEDKAIEMGVPVETAKKIDQSEREEARRQKAEQRTLEQQAIQQHFAKLEQQAEALKQTFPDFDLRKELQNPVFARMTSPSVGLSVEDAHYAVHRKEIQTAAMQVTAQKTAQKISNSIQAGQRRPAENGAYSQAPSVTSFDYSKASKEQRDVLKKQIRSAAARGQKIYPGR